LKEWILAESPPKKPFELQTTWEKKPRKTVKKMEYNRNRPLGLILEEEEEEIPSNNLKITQIRI
jgi:hypothetical protein